MAEDLQCIGIAIGEDGEVVLARRNRARQIDDVSIDARGDSSLGQTLADRLSDSLGRGVVGILSNASIGKLHGNHGFPLSPKKNRPDFRRAVAFVQVIGDAITVRPASWS